MRTRRCHCFLLVCHWLCQCWTLRRVLGYRLTSTAIIAILLLQSWASQSACGQNQATRYPLQQALQQHAPYATPKSVEAATASAPQDLPSPTPIQAETVPPPTAGPSVGTGPFTLADQPKFGASYFEQTPRIGCDSALVEYGPGDFAPDPIDPDAPYDSESSIWVYRGKSAVATQRPLVEIGRPWFQYGQLCPSSTIFGRANLAAPQFIVFGDFRVAAASNTSAGDNANLVAVEANLNFDLKITSTERFHFFISPFDRGGLNSRWLLDEGDFVSEFDPNVEFGFFEGDLGAIAGGFCGQTLPFDLPIAAGFMPLVFQNGIWLEDAMIGLAATVPARNNARWDIPNMDTTFFWAFDELSSEAFDNDDEAAKVYGVASFIEAWGGYWETDYAFLEDRDAQLDRSYHNIALAYTRRYGRWLSNSVRWVSNAGQSTEGGPNTADGYLVLIENSLITAAPTTIVPYCNLFFGSDRPQSVARDPGAGQILKNTGILFEPDGMTDYPTLDATANDTYGGALGLNLLSADFCQQLVLEGAFLQVRGNDATRIAAGDQYGLGFRYQRPISNAAILRFDGMLGFLDNADDLSGLRVELRRKF